MHAPLHCLQEAEHGAQNQQGLPRVRRLRRQQRQNPNNDWCPLAVQIVPRLAGPMVAQRVLVVSLVFGDATCYAQVVHVRRLEQRLRAVIQKLQHLQPHAMYGSQVDP